MTTNYNNCLIDLEIKIPRIQHKHVNISSYNAWAVQHQKNVDLEECLRVEVYQMLCQFCGELGKAGSEYEPDNFMCFWTIWDK